MEAGYIAEKALGYQQITALGSAVALTVPDNCCLALITVEAQAVRYRDDGTDPTAAVGMPVAVGVTLRYTSAQIKRLKFIESTAGALLNITYYG